MNEHVASFMTGFVLAAVSFAIGYFMGRTHDRLANQADAGDHRSALTLPAHLDLMGGKKCPKETKG
jgi:hypothetical protein